MTMTRTQQLTTLFILLAIAAIAVALFHTQLLHAMLLPMPVGGCGTHGC